MEQLETLTVDNLLEFLYVPKAKHKQISIPVSDAFVEAFMQAKNGSILEGEQAEAIYEIYSAYLKEYETSVDPDNAVLLEAGVALHNSAIRVPLDLLSRKKLQIEGVLELTQSESVSEDRDFQVLRVKALNEKISTLISEDHNFIDAFASLKEIKEISEKHNILSADNPIWNNFILHALEVYPIQSETGEYEDLVAEVIEDFERVDIHMRWDVLLKLMRSLDLSEADFNLLSRARHFYIDCLRNDKELIKSGWAEPIERAEKRTKRRMLGDRLLDLAKDSKREELQFERLKDFFLEDYAEDRQGKEDLAEITAHEGLANRDPKLLAEGITQYDTLGVDFHVAEFKIKSHLEFTDLEDETVGEIAKKDLFKSLGIIAKSLGEMPVDVFTEMVDDPRLQQAHYRKLVQAVSDIEIEVENDYVSGIRAVLSEYKHTDYLKDVIELILRIYKDPKKVPINLLNQALTEHKNYVSGVRHFEWIDGEMIEVNIDDPRPVTVMLGSTSHVGLHMVQKGIEKNAFQAILPAGRGGKKRMGQFLGRTLGAKDAGIDVGKYMEDGNIHAPTNLDFFAPQLGLDDQVMSTLGEISEAAQLVIVNNVAIVDFLREGDDPEAIKNLYKVNTQGPKELYRLIQQYCPRALLAHTDTWFRGEGNQLYEDSKRQTHNYLKEDDGNIITLSPPIVGGQSAEGSSPYSTINLDGPFAVMKMFDTLLAENQLVIDVAKETPMHMVSVDKLGGLMVDHILQRLASGKKHFETVDCIGGDSQTITPQDTLNTIVSIHNMLQKTNFSHDRIKAGDENMGFDPMSSMMLDRFFPYARPNPNRRNSEIGYPRVGVGPELFFRQILWLALRNFRQKGKVKYDVDETTINKIVCNL